MDRRVRAVAAALLLLVAAAVGVGLADPFRDAPPAPRVDADDPPAAMARDALQATRGADHVVEWYFGNATALEGPVGRAAVENTEREVYAVSNQTGTRYVTYADEQISWQGHPGEMTRNPWGWDTYNSFVESVAPLDRPDADVRVVSCNDSAVVLRVADTDAAYAITHDEPNVTRTETGRRSDVRANLTLVVSRATGRLDRATLRVSRDDTDEAGRRVSVTAYRYSDWGDADARRPDGAGYSLVEFLLDATNHD